jgi:hypothetical protein
MAKRMSALLVFLIVIVCSGLLVVAIKRSQEAALHAGCTKNLRQLCGAIHNYYDVYKCFPNATVTRGHMGTVPLEKRMSWQFATLPLIEVLMDSEYGLAYVKGLDHAWDAPENQLYLNWHYPTFLCPGNPEQGVSNGPGLNHYIGLTGLGSEAARLPIGNKRAGLFRWEGCTRADDITDGTSTTAMVAETLRDIGPWVGPGRPTTRGLDPGNLPYLGPAAQFGSGHRSINLGMADGSVRAMHDSIAPEVFEALVTIAGGEQVDQEEIPMVGGAK